MPHNSRPTTETGGAVDLRNNLKKLSNNFSLSAIKVLGLKNYCLYVCTLIKQSHDIFRKGDLRPLDKAMGHYSIRKFKFRDSTFNFDCKRSEERRVGKECRSGWW